MKVYLLWWDNGMKHDDHDVQLLGIYSTEEKRLKAQELFTRTREYYEGHYHYTEEETDVVKQRISV